MNKQISKLIITKKMRWVSTCVCAWACVCACKGVRKYEFHSQGGGQRQRERERPAAEPGAHEPGGLLYVACLYVP
jgi:hypothetical protein